jgi:hypothetical protein
MCIRYMYLYVYIRTLSWMQMYLHEFVNKDDDFHSDVFEYVCIYIHIYIYIYVYVC